MIIKNTTGQYKKTLGIVQQKKIDDDFKGAIQYTTLLNEFIHIEKQDNV